MRSSPHVDGATAHPDDAAPSSGSGIHLRILATALVGGIAGMLPFFLVGAMAVQISSGLGISDAQLGLAASTFFVTAALASRPLGRRVDQVGWRRGLAVGAACSAVSLAIMGFLGGTWAVLVIGLVIGGFAQAWCIPASNLLIVQEMPQDRQGLTFGIKQASGPFTTMLGGLAVPGIALTLGWRWAFAAALVVPTIAVVLTRSTTTYPLPGTSPPAALRQTRSSSSPNLVALSVAGWLSAMVVGALSAFVVVSAVSAGMTEASAGLLLALASLIGGTMRVGFGWWVDRFDSDGFRPVATLLMLGAVGLLLLATQRVAFVIPGTLIVFMTAWGWPGLYHYAVTRANPVDAGHATGVVQVGTSLGMALGPASFGVLSDHAGYTVAWIVAAGVSVTASLLLLRATALGAHARHAR